MRNGRGRGHGPGSTLLELLVALGILASVLIVAAGILPFSHLVNHQAAERSFAQDLALSLLERARAQPFDDLAPETQTVQGPGCTFVARTEIMDHPEAGVPAMLKRVRVTVTWTGGETSLAHEILVARMAP